MHLVFVDGILLHSHLYVSEAIHVAIFRVVKSRTQM